MNQQFEDDVLDDAFSVNYWTVRQRQPKLAPIRRRPSPRRRTNWFVIAVFVALLLWAVIL